MTPARWGWAPLFCLAAAFAPAFAQRAPSGEPKIEGQARDAEFGVGTRHVALQRRVEMYQWRKVGEGYVAAWSERIQDSRGFDAMHRNPPAFPLSSREWRTARVTLDGKPLAREAIDALGAWHELRPDFSRLPANLAATFQPEGDGLGSAENPLDPKIGDLRITWRELKLPPLADAVILRDGVWHAAAEAKPAATRGPAPSAPEPSRDWSMLAWLLIAGAAALLLWLLLSWISKRRR